MPHNRKRANFNRQAERVREIADGIFDRAERFAVLAFVAEAEKLASVAPPSAIMSSLSAGEPRD
jgi:hypothetical protein